MASRIRHIKLRTKLWACVSRRFFFLLKQRHLIKIHTSDDTSTDVRKSIIRKIIIKEEKYFHLFRTRILKLIYVNPLLRKLKIKKNLTKLINVASFMITHNFADQLEKYGFFLFLSKFFPLDNFTSANRHLPPLCG